MLKGCQKSRRIHIPAFSLVEQHTISFSFCILIKTKNVVDLLRREDKTKGVGGEDRGHDLQRDSLGIPSEGLSDRKKEARTNRLVHAHPHAHPNIRYADSKEIEQDKKSRFLKSKSLRARVCKKEEEKMVVQARSQEKAAKGETMDHQVKSFRGRHRFSGVDMTPDQPFQRGWITMKAGQMYVLLAVGLGERGSQGAFDTVCGASV